MLATEIIATASSSSSINCTFAVLKDPLLKMTTKETRPQKPLTNLLRPPPNSCSAHMAALTQRFEAADTRGYVQWMMRRILRQVGSVQDLVDSQY